MDLAEMQYLKPKCIASNDSTLSVGVHIPFNNPAAFPEDIQTKLKHAGQNVRLEIDLGTCVEELLASDKPLIKHLMQGFRFHIEMSVISNLKKLLLELSKNEEHGEKIATAGMMFAPAFMLSLNGQIHLEFDDFSEVEDHPLA
jgi:hypothetical protein